MLPTSDSPAPSVFWISLFIMTKEGEKVLALIIFFLLHTHFPSCFMLLCRYALKNLNSTLESDLKPFQFYVNLLLLCHLFWNLRFFSIFQFKQVLLSVNVHVHTCLFTCTIRLFLVVPCHKIINWSLKNLSVLIQKSGDEGLKVVNFAAVQLTSCQVQTWDVCLNLFCQEMQNLLFTQVMVYICHWRQ